MTTKRKKKKFTDRLTQSSRRMNWILLIVVAPTVLLTEGLPFVPLRSSRLSRNPSPWSKTSLNLKAARRPSSRTRNLMRKRSSKPSTPGTHLVIKMPTSPGNSSSKPVLWFAPRSRMVSRKSRKVQLPRSSTSPLRKRNDQPPHAMLLDTLDESPSKSLSTLEQDLVSSARKPSIGLDGISMDLQKPPWSSLMDQKLSPLE